MNSFKRNYNFLGIAFLAVLLLASSFSFAREADPNAVAQRRQQLEEDLKNLEGQIDDLSSDIEGLQRQATTLQRDIAIYDAQIAKARLEIKARDLSIAKLTEGINERSRLVEALLEKINREKASLAELLRRQNELDSISLLEVVLGYDKLSDFFADSDNFESIQRAVQVSFSEIRQTKEHAEQEKEQLQNQKSEEMELRNLQALEKQRVEQAKMAKDTLLRATSGKEKDYQKILSQRQKDAATIRSELFILRGSPAIPFEKALEYANIAFRATGIRPAFLLGVIAEESELGANLGSGNWKTSMYDCYRKLGYITAAEKQKTAFLAITAELGLDPDLMPVSAKPGYGCGGAMGPAQFMPTTWKLYEDRIAKITGHNPPSPWDPFDAFAAAALYLKDSGGANGKAVSAGSCSYKWCIANNECKAALKYLAGSNWHKFAYAFYGCDVMALAAKYQEQINILGGI